MSFEGIRDAATVVLLRGSGTPNPRILLGQRGSNAVFMPSKFVFPGGAIDSMDFEMQPVGRPDDICRDRLTRHVRRDITENLLLCAVREVWEETGLRLASRASDPDTPVPESWQPFCSGGVRPDASGLVFFYRAITPPGRTRRYDARFFLADLNLVSLLGNADDFSLASGELSQLQWVSLAEAKQLDLPSITRLVLQSASQLLPGNKAPASVPFRFSNDGTSELWQI